DAGAADPITFDDFLRVDIRIGTIIEAEPFPEARKPAFKLQIDFGPAIGVKHSSAQIVDRYALEQLPGRPVAAGVDVPPRQTGKRRSEGLTLGFADAEGAVTLFAPDGKVPNGSRLFSRSMAA